VCLHPDDAQPHAFMPALLGRPLRLAKSEAVAIAIFQQVGLVQRDQDQTGAD
jgi:hypothetical protein